MDLSSQYHKRNSHPTWLITQALGLPKQKQTQHGYSNILGICKTVSIWRNSTCGGHRRELLVQQCDRGSIRVFRFCALLNADRGGVQGGGGSLVSSKYVLFFSSGECPFQRNGTASPLSEQHRPPRRSRSRFEKESTEPHTPWE